MNFDKAFDLAITMLKANIMFALWGHPGIGKSALGQLLANKFELFFIDMRLGQIDPVDLNGFVHKNEVAGNFDYLPWARFPLEGAELPIMYGPDGKMLVEADGLTPRRYKGWLIMFDEVNTAPRQNLAAAYKVFLDRMIGQYKLHPRVRLMMGGNLVGEGLAGALPSPLVSRAAHIVMTPELTPTVRQILGPSISAFLTNHPKFIYLETNEPNTPFPTFRTWEMVRKHQLANGGSSSLEAMSAIVGSAAAVSYVSFAMQEQELLGYLNGVEAFPLEKSQDLLDYLSCDVVQLERHLHRFVAEWHTIASVKVENLKNGTTP
jgi:MoxR-like ATPases